VEVRLTEVEVLPVDVFTDDSLIVEGAAVEDGLLTELLEEELAAGRVVLIFDDELDPEEGRLVLLVPVVPDGRLTDVSAGRVVLPGRLVPLLSGRLTFVFEGELVPEEGRLVLTPDEEPGLLVLFVLLEGRVELFSFTLEAGRLPDGRLVDVPDELVPVDGLVVELPDGRLVPDPVLVPGLLGDV